MNNFWDERYSEDGLAYGTLPNDFLAANNQQIKPNGEVLCLAEGEGRNAIFLAHQGFQVTAVDFSHVGMEKTQARATREGVKLTTVVADLAEFDLGENKWDAVISIFAHLPPDLRSVVHAKVEKGLKPGGLLLLEAYRPEQLQYGTGGPAKNEMMLNTERIKKEFSHLKTEWLSEFDREIHEGKYHNGMSAVVQFIGRK